jgi:hypothetical protein
MSKQYQAGVSRRRGHIRAQLLYATEGVMRVTTEHGVWMLPPRRAC